MAAHGDGSPRRKLAGRLGRLRGRHGSRTCKSQTLKRQESNSQAKRVKLSSARSQTPKRKECVRGLARHALEPRCCWLSTLLSTIHQPSPNHPTPTHAYAHTPTNMIWRRCNCCCVLLLMLLLLLLLLLLPALL